MNVSIFGLGYVGAVSLACLAREGHRVVGVDVDAAKLKMISDGKTPVVEEGMVELMAKVAASGLVEVTTDATRALHGSEVSLVCVGTPSAPNGSQDQGAILRLCEQLGAALRSADHCHTFVFRSTLVPGTVNRTHGSLRQRRAFSLNANPNRYTTPGGPVMNHTGTVPRI